MVRSLELAELVASGLTGGEAHTHADRSVASSPTQHVVRYSAVRARRGSTLIVGDDRGRDKGRFRPGIIGATSDRELAERVAGFLNRLDPAVFKPPPKRISFGWW